MAVNEWKYKVTVIDDTWNYKPDGVKAGKEMDDMGKQGWELVAVVPIRINFPVNTNYPQTITKIALYWKMQIR